MEFEAEEQIQIQNTNLMNESQTLPLAAPLKLDPPGPLAPEVCQQPGKAISSNRSYRPKAHREAYRNQSWVREGIVLASVIFPPVSGIRCATQHKHGRLGPKLGIDFGQVNQLTNYCLTKIVNIPHWPKK